MGMQPDMSPFGSQTVTGPGWPNVDEDALGAAAAQYEAMAAKITGTVVPQQQGQLMKLADAWQGGSAVAAAGGSLIPLGMRGPSSRIRAWKWTAPRRWNSATLAYCTVATSGNA